SRRAERRLGGARGGHRQDRAELVVGRELPGGYRGFGRIVEKLAPERRARRVTHLRHRFVLAEASGGANHVALEGAALDVAQDPRPVLLVGVVALDDLLKLEAQP